MINESLENLIDESVNFNEIYDQIRNQRRGVLHKIIELIIDSSNDYRSQKKQIVEDVCKHFGIKIIMRYKMILELLIIIFLNLI